MSILTKLAKGQDCQIRIPGHCNFDSATTVLAHDNGAGMSIKHHDLLATHACSACHDVVDGRVKVKINPLLIRLYLLEGILRTIGWLISRGYVEIVNAPQAKIQKILPRRF